LTGKICEGGRDVAGGCIHEEIAKHFPGLAPLIKWHLCASDGPMHYVANTVYHAGNRDYNGKQKGERYHVRGREEKRIVFGEFPITFEFKDGFTQFIESCPDWKLVQPVAVEHPPEEKTNYKFAPKWTVSGHACEWYQCPFDREEEAQDFIKACREYTPRIVVFAEKFTQVGEGKERKFDLARLSAVWPDATDEQLSAEPEELKAMLLARLPGLLKEFRAAMESLGFTY
jgi:hypothetical protein